MLYNNNLPRPIRIPKQDLWSLPKLPLLKRGVCCGNLCRHCPYGWSNASITNDDVKRPKQKVQSGNQIQITALLQSHQQQSNEWQQQQERLEEEQQQPIHIESLTNEVNSSTFNATKVTTKSSNAKTGGRHGGTLTKKNVPYTRSGDAGTSQLLTGERRRKDDTVFEAMGDVDELCSVTGLVYAELQRLHVEKKNDNVNAKKDEEIVSENKIHDLEEWLLDIMSRLFDIGSHVAKPRKVQQEDDDDSSDTENDKDISFKADGIGGGFASDHIDTLESWIDIMTEELPELTFFILPTGSCSAAQLHVARTVCRRAERHVTSLSLNHPGSIDPNSVKYLNRLSDFYFTAARYVNYLEHRDEIQYRRPVRGAKQRDRITITYQPDDDSKQSNSNGNHNQ